MIVVVMPFVMAAVVMAVFMPAFMPMMVFMATAGTAFIIIFFC